MIEDLFEKSDPFNCRHEGVGLPGCPVCDPNPKHVIAAYRWQWRKLDAALAEQRAELGRAREALVHMQCCRPCAESSWEACDGGRAALEVLGQRAPEDQPLMSATDGKVELKFHVPLRTGRGENNREHPMVRAKRVKAEHHAVFLSTLGLVRALLTSIAGAALPRCTLTLTRISPGPGLDGHDNLKGSLKGVVDELANILGVKDNDPRLTWEYAPQERGEWGVRVHLVATLKVPEVVAPKASMSAPRQKHSRGPKKNAPLAARRGLDQKVAAFLGAKPAFTPPPGRSA